MTTISRLGATRASAGVRRTQTHAESFALPAATAASVAAEPVTAADPALLGGLLAVQEALSERAQNRLARERGEAILGALSRLQLSLLAATTGGGTSDRAVLARLVELASGAPAAADPALAEALRAVALRARVELARRGHTEECDPT